MDKNFITRIVKDLESKGAAPASTTDIIGQVGDQIERVRNRLSRISHKMAVMSGKGGVGKSSVTVNLALSFAKKGFKVGILDADISGPSIPKMLGIGGRTINITPEGAIPAVSHLGIKVASMDLMLKGNNTPVVWKGTWQDSAVWRGALEMGVIRELLADVVWGDLDLLLIDMPPASSDKPPVIANLIPDMDGAIMVTIPTEVSQHIVRKSITFATKELNIPIVGLIENMTSFICPECGHKSGLFSEGSIKEMGIPIIGEIPFDSRISGSADRGLPFIIEFPDAPASLSFLSIADKIIDQFFNKETRQ
jgi:ATP-binding protein involved in chromosome partitioning